MKQPQNTAADEPGWILPAHGALLASGVTVTGHVPDGGLKHLIQRLDHDDTVTNVRLATEEEGIALAAGAWLGGARSAVLMQSSGVGNCINMLSLLKVCAIPTVLVITMRGQRGEANPWQVPMSSAVVPCLEAMGVSVATADRAEQVAPLIDQACEHAYRSRRGPAAVLVAQAVVGVKQFVGDAGVNDGHSPDATDLNPTGTPHA